jgi:outer membrane protein assembly factor BamA
MNNTNGKWQMENVKSSPSWGSWVGPFAVSHLPFACLTLCVHLCVLLSLSHATPIIRNITIEGNTRTRTEIIQRELIFQSGQPLDTLKTAETERNLRRLYFLGNVTFHIQQDSLFADITIRVKDLYARALSPLLEGNKNELSYGITALDFNFLGRGQITQLTAFHDAVTGNSARFYYHNPRLNGSHYAITSNTGIADEGHHLILSLTHPFYTLDTPWNYGFSIYNQEQIQRRYRGGILADKYNDRISGGNLWVIRSYGKTIKARPGLQLSISDQKFTPETSYTYSPKNRRRILPAFTFTLWKPHYEKQVFVRQLGRTEDLQMGSSIYTRLGISSKMLGSDQNHLFYTLQVSPRYKPTENTFLFAHFSLSGRYQNSTYTNLFSQAELTFYTRINNIHTLAFRARYNTLSRPEDNDQLLLGLNRGLRGYLPRRFDGTRRYTLNIEARPTLYQHRTFIVGSAFFVDTGDAWTPHQTSPTFNTAAGLGLRFAASNVYDQPILRTDLAYAIQDRAWQISLGLGHYF